MTKPAMDEFVRRLWAELAPVCAVQNEHQFDLPKEIDRLLASKPTFRRVTADMLADMIGKAVTGELK